MMNERFKQLAEQAWTLVSDEERNKGELYEADRQRERRDQVFAELIVQECICLVLNGKYDSDKYDPNAEFHCGHNIALDGAAEGLQQYFGIE